MSELLPRNLPHLVVRDRVSSESYTSPTGGPRQFRIPPRDAQGHAQKLREELREIERELAEIRQGRAARNLTTEFGFQLEFEGVPGFDLAVESLERVNHGIMLLNIRRRMVRVGEEDLPQFVALVWVPHGKLDVFEELVRDYGSRVRKSGRPYNNTLVAGIEAIRRAALEALWTESDAFPDPTTRWWEAWLRAPNSTERETIEQLFRQEAARLGIRIWRGVVRLAETTVLLIEATAQQLRESIALLNCLSELRKPQTTAAFFTELPPVQQADWVNALVGLVQPPAPGANAVCLLDSGINQGHPLLAPGVPANGIHTYDNAWGTADTWQPHGHGTQMAGLGLFGDLTPMMSATEPVQLPHLVESVKLVEHRHATQPELYGHVTAECVSRVEVGAPRRSRVFSLQVTTGGACDGGRPSSWSAAIDQLAAATGEEPQQPRLFFVSAGNAILRPGDQCPDLNDLSGVHDPAQAWNAISAGAMTNKALITEPEYQGWNLVGQPGGLCPSSSTSVPWENQWPVKPDLVMEGGNYVANPATGDVHPPDSLQLLTTHRDFRQHLLITTGDTSAATVLAARFGAAIQRAYPDLWPETIRALLIQSCWWTPHMFGNREPTEISEDEWKLILRRYGHGVPDLATALRSAENAATLIVQDEIQPFALDGSEVKTSELRFHDLPWPVQVLQDNFAAHVRLKVTLSYFIEPNPGPGTLKQPVRYPNCGLRFAVQGKQESRRQFHARINRQARDAETPGSGSPSDSRDWLLPQSLRFRGSIHSDVWTGSAADLAAKASIAIYPTSGWWRYRKALRRYEAKVRYALVVTLEAPEVPIPIYTAIATEIGVPIPIVVDWL